ncbi:DUF342 domain-containing protein [Bacillus sp. A301a_S52]|jgi:uncharacterized protein (DUF342 family)|nr:DUF342 domain-containing protein [Bacillus sp. A301a_S52]
MEELHEILTIEVSRDKMSAKLKQLQPLPEEMTVDDLKKFVKENGVTYGLFEETIEKIVTGNVNLPAIIAKGLDPIDGENAYIWSILEDLQDEGSAQQNEEEDINLKKVIEIPSVENGELVGKKIEATEEKNGVNVYGEDVKAKPGRDIKLRPGKNTRVDGLEIFSTIDGQISVEPKVIHVFPIYEVNGDVDMKVGNIDFIGNVNIRGNVPSGFEIKAQGDIRVHGSVEAAVLKAGGSIFIQQGVVAQGGGIISAEGDVETSFLNQANIEAGGDVKVTKSILHSTVKAQGFVYCNQNRGNIVGGSISSGKGIEVNEVGNHMNTPTTLFLGVSEEAVASESKYKTQMLKAQENTQKLGVLLKNIVDKEKISPLTAKEKVMKLKIKNSLMDANKELNSAKDKLDEIKELFENQDQAEIRIIKAIHANTDLHFGKYRRKIVTTHEHVLFKLDRSEISFEPL